MADSPIPQMKAPNSQFQASNQPPLSHPPPLQSSIQVQTTTRKKKEIINLLSSEEKDLSKNHDSPKKNGESQNVGEKKTKMKKTTLKCQLCKGNGKKSEMKNCGACKLMFHINCLEQNEIKKKYVCDRCRIDKPSQSKALKKQKKLEDKNQQIDKTTQKKIQKEKKKDECYRTLQVFTQKYPYYVGDDNKIKFPIEDKLLYIYREYFQPSEMKLTPTEHPIIPTKYLGDFLQIENFLTSFYDEIQPFYAGETRKNCLYQLMNCQGTDKTFQNLLAVLIKIYLKDIFEKNKTENVKILNDHCFFIILGNIGQMDDLSLYYLAYIAPEIIRYLSKVPSMKKAFDNFEFPTFLTIQTKLYVILTLIQGLSEVDGFHDMVSRKSEKMSQMTKEKANLVTRVKKDEAQALSNKEKVKEMMINIGEKDMNEEDQKMSKEVQKNKKKTAKMNNQREQTEQTIKELKEKISKISKYIPFAISEMMFLGTDRNKSQYFFFLKEHNRVYVRYHNFLLDNNSSYKLYEGKEKIVELLKSLNVKGINEKHLHESLNSLIKDQIIKNNTEEEDMQMILEPVEGTAIFQDEIFKGKIIQDVLDIQEKFSTYLSMRNCQWSSPTKREEFRFGFAYIEDCQALKEAIKNLQESFLFVQVIKQRQRIREEKDSDSNEEKDPIILQKGLSRRKKPIRLWGMNAQKIKKYWAEYLETATSFMGIWICVNVLRNYVHKYLDKKMQALREQEKRLQVERQKEIHEQQIRIQRQIREREREEERRRQKERMIEKKANARRTREVTFAEINEVYQHSESSKSGKKPNLRKSTRIKNKALTIDSDEEADPSEDSNNEDECGVCGEFGDMICCDSCPKVFHIECLKLKEVPEGEWNCITCLERMSNTRQTRSRMKKIGK